MKLPLKRFLFTALLYGIGVFVITHFDLLFNNDTSSEVSWYKTLFISLLGGLLFAWTQERADTYIERKNARWKARKEAEKE